MDFLLVIVYNIVNNIANKIKCFCIDSMKNCNCFTKKNK